MSTLLLSPHNDDAVLFAAFAAMHYDARVVTVFDSLVQPSRSVDPETHWRTSAIARRTEDLRAMAALHLRGPYFLGLEDSLPVDRLPKPQMLIDAACGLAFGGDEVSRIILPMYEEGGHDQHNYVAKMLPADWEALAIVRYSTYTRAEGRTKRTKEGHALKNAQDKGFQRPWMIQRKLAAMACYDSQITIEALGCWPWFMDLQEYYL